jgi:23S rRNA (cytosine1962-C5)-methyltransferase
MSDLSGPALEQAVAARADLVDAEHRVAFRLFNGFTEGSPGLTCDLYGKTLVLSDHADGPDGAAATARAAAEIVRARLPWIQATLWKVVRAPTVGVRAGRLLFGGKADLERSVAEAGVLYALALTLHGGPSLYLDTRELRAWARTTLAGKRVLNAFAYTGSLGVAARAAPAEVVHVDRRRAFLDVARASYALNGFAVRRADFRGEDFFTCTARLRREGALFDAVFLDPPLFSATERGRVDLVSAANRLIDKVRPLVGDGGWLVAVNNALWVSGAEYLGLLEAASADGYLELEALLPVPPDVVGFRAAGASVWPADPAPFNHPTKIAVLRVRRKDGRRP